MATDYYPRIEQDQKFQEIEKKIATITSGSFGPITPATAATFTTDGFATAAEVGDYVFAPGTADEVTITVTAADRTNAVVKINKKGTAYTKEIIPLGFEATEIATLIAPDQTAKAAEASQVAEISLVRYPETYFEIIEDSYARRTDGQLVDAPGSGYYRTNPLLISDLLKDNKLGYLLIDIGNFGSGIIPVAYYPSANASSANYISGEIATTSSGAVQLLKQKLTKPASATHVVFSWHNTFKFNLIKIPEFAPISKQLTNTGNIANLNKSVLVDIPIPKAYGYVRKSDGVKVLGDSGDYFISKKYILADLLAENPTGEFYVDIGNFGGAIAPIAYFKANDDFIGYEIESTSSGAVQLTKYKLNIPAETDHFYLSCNKNYLFNFFSSSSKGLKGERLQDSLMNVLSQAMSLPSGFNLASDFMKKRGIKKAISTGYHHLVIIEGQSNADGREQQANAPQWFIDMNYKMDDFLMWNRFTSNFEPYELGVSTGADTNTSTNFGFDIFFAKAYLDANPGKKLYCMKHTKGGTAIYEAGGASQNARWQPKTELITNGDRKLVDEYEIKLRNIISWCNGNGVRLMPIANLNSQGETDGDIGPLAIAAYPQNKRNLIAYLRGLWNLKQLPYISITLNSQAGPNSGDSYQQINAILEAIDAEDDYYSLIDMAAYEPGADVHYKVAGLEYAGTQMFDILSTYEAF